MVKIEVTDEVHAPSNPNRPRNQVAYAHLAGRDGKAQPHPERVFIPLWREDKPFAAGLYTLAPQSVYADKWRSLALTPKLVPIAAR
jgi:hypothetical protein